MNEKGVLASLSPELMDRICDALIAKLALKNEGDLLPKQGVVGSNPITRSTFIPQVAARLLACSLSAVPNCSANAEEQRVVSNDVHWGYLAMGERQRV